MFHYTPTSPAWLNAVEGLLRQADPAPPQTRGVFRSLVNLQAAINRFLAETDDHPKPSVWTAAR